MSFGFGVGDFVAVAKVIHNLSARFTNAPEEFAEVTTLVETLSSVVQNIEDTWSRNEITETDAALLGTLSKQCTQRLDKIQTLLNQFQDISSDSESKSARVRRVWKRLRWDVAHVNAMRDGVSWCVDAYNLFLTSLTHSQNTNLRSDVRELTNSVNRWQGDQDRQAVLEFITGKNYAIEQKDLSRLQQAGTGRWFIDSVEFQSWMVGKSRTLFCPGIPGAGKTVMTSIVVNHLQETFQSDTSIAGMDPFSSVVGVAYTYCNFRRHSEQDVESLLASLLKQLVQQQPYLPEEVKTAYQKFKDQGTGLSEQRIIDILHSICPRFSRVFILIDALDECQTAYETQRSLVATLLALQKTVPGVHFLATSRSIPELVSLFDGCPTLEIRAAEQDVRDYVKGHISQLPPCASKDLKLQEDIITCITRAVEGMFLLARLHLESLRGKRSPKAIRTVLQKLPSGSNAYHKAYEEAMNRISGQLEDERDVAHDLLSWVCSARRPLTATEILNALAVEIGEDSFDEDNMSEMEWVISFCAGLVTHDRESDVVRLVHYTAQEYFEQETSRWFPNAPFYIATVCLTYVSFDAFRHGFCASDAAFTTRCREYPLFRYSTTYWAEHLRGLNLDSLKDEDKELIDELLVKFLSNDGAAAAAWQSAFVSIFDGGQGSTPSNQCNSQLAPRNATGLHLTSYYGLEKATTLLLAEGLDVNTADTYGRTPLLWAAFKGHEATVKELVTAGADVSCSDVDGRTALQHAVETDNLGIATFLVDAGADPNTRDKKGHTPLLWAVEKRQTEMLQLLLSYGADVNLQGTSDYAQETTALSTAVREGRTEFIDLLISHGAAVEAKDHLNRTAIMYAALHGNQDAVVRLLEESPELDIPDEYGLTPLTGAANNGHMAIVSLLLSKGANPSLKNAYGESPLYRAAIFGHLNVASLFLEGGADVEARNNEGYTPLLGAAKSDMFGAVPLLLKHGADVEARDPAGRTALSYAAHQGALVMMILLLQHGADPLSTDNNGKTPAAWAEWTGQQALLQLLLTPGLRVQVDANALEYSLQLGQLPTLPGLRGDDIALFHIVRERFEKLGHLDGGMGGLLLVAASRGLSQTAQLLIQRGVDLECRNRSGRTPLLLALSSNRGAIVRSLLDAKANVQAKDREGITALIMAAKDTADDVERVDLLLKAGAQPNEADNIGRTPLSYAAGSLHVNSVALLLKHGAEPNIADLEGKTALFWALRPGITHANTMRATDLPSWSVLIDKNNLTVQLLLEGGASPNTTNTEGDTPLLLICRSSEFKPECVRLLIEYGADPNARDRQGRTALSLAAGVYNLPVMQALLEKGADPNMMDQDGGTALLKAMVTSGDSGDGALRESVVNLLIEHGARVSK